MAHPFDLDTFVSNYVETIRFTDAGPGDDIPQDAELDAESLQRCRDECAAFLWRVYPLLDNAARVIGEDPADTYERAARDFWFTRCGHGVGFWEDDRWPVSGDLLDKVATGFGNVDAYETDSGHIGLM